MAEGARLESVFRGNSNVGSNPTLSAISSYPAKSTSVPRIASNVLKEVRSMMQALVRDNPVTVGRLLEQGTNLITNWRNAFRKTKTAERRLSAISKSPGGNIPLLLRTVKIEQQKCFRMQKRTAKGGENMLELATRLVRIITRRPGGGVSLDTPFEPGVLRK